MNFDFNAFYTERNKRLTIPDEDIQAYGKRVKISSAKSQGMFLSPFEDTPQARMPSGNVQKSPSPPINIEDMSSFGNSSQCDHTRRSGSPETLADGVIPCSVEYSKTVPPSISPFATASVASKIIQANDHNSRGCGTDVTICNQSRTDSSNVNRDLATSPLLVQARQTCLNSMNGVLDGATTKQSHENVQNAVVAPRKSPSPSPFLCHNSDDRISLDGDIFSSSLNQSLVRKPIESGNQAQSRQPLHFSNEFSSPIEDASDIMDILPSPRSGILGSVRSERSRSDRARRQAAKRATGKHEKLIKLGIKTKTIQMTSGAVSRKKSISDQSSIIDESSPDLPSPPPQAVTPSGTLAAGLVPKGPDLSETNIKKKRVTEKKDKAKVKPMLPEEYALMLMEKAQSEHYSAARKKYVQSLTGKNIFYTGGDMRHATERTRSRMDIIVRHGGNLIPKFDVSVVTHIVTDAQKGPTLRALGVRNFDNIPDHIPTVKWSWVVSCIGATQGDTRLNEFWLYAAFSERINAGILKSSSVVPRNRTKDTILDVVDISHISQFTQDGNLRKQRNLADIEDISEFPDPDNVQYPLPRASVDVTKTHDPLEEFYAKAKADLENGGSYHSDSDFGSGSDHSGFEFHPVMPLKKKGWTCDRKPDEIDIYPNQDVIDKLQELMEIHKSKLGEEDRWRAFSYSKCIRILKSYPHRIQSLSQARAIPGVGEKTAHKIIEIIETGQLRRINYENTGDIKVTKLFQGIYGVGQSIAHQWYAAGCRTLDDLLAGKGGIKLNSAQEIGIKFYSDINSRMPRDEAKAIFDIIKPIALQLDPELFVEIMGSFRRGKADCGDIDILITRPTDDGKTHAGILSRLLWELHAAKILTEDLALPENPHDLESIYRGLCHLPKEGSKRRRIDFLTVPWQSRGAALLYYTGDDVFNRAMRMKARVMGYSLNQRGLFAGVVRDPHDRTKKLNPGQLIASETEEEIFGILEVPWQEPHERIRG